SDISVPPLTLEQTTSSDAVPALSDIPVCLAEGASPLDLSAWPIQQLEHWLTMANAAAALSTTRYGAVSSLPAWPDVCAFAQTERV
ncbi:MAG: hypothetical protein K6T31_08805, partial [Alicyclobacillus sp.]|nr:hypothetical protein [Alicyclobacillus sp.]